MSYQSDLHEWTKEQADALRRRASNALDWDNLAEEIESLGSSQRREIRSRLKILLVHLLKWKHQPEGRCGNWRGSIEEARDQIEDLLEENPSLRTYPEECLAKAYASARRRALDETGLLGLPEACPWSVDKVIAADFLP
ncbi:MAG TPA: DUF29 domain-containing protein [Roseiarcus sp.]|nr:DUF29 domain-containing protein [Roseiarcus sp.]